MSDEKREQEVTYLFKYQVSIKGLRLATIRCPHCNTGLTLDLGVEFDPVSGRQPFKTPSQCPRCDRPYDSALPAALDNLQRAFRALADLNLVSFQIKG